MQDNHLIKKQAAKLVEKLVGEGLSIPPKWFNTYTDADEELSWMDEKPTFSANVGPEEIKVWVKGDKSLVSIFDEERLYPFAMDSITFVDLKRRLRAYFNEN